MWRTLALAFVLAGCSSAALTLDYGVPTSCVGLPTTPLGAPQLATLWAACAADGVCAAQYTEATFGAMLVLFTTLPHTLEGGVVATICGQTLEQIQAALWVYALNVGALTNTGCAPGERFFDGACVTEQDVTLSNCANYYSFSVVVLAFAVVVFVIITIGLMIHRWRMALTHQKRI
jgi:hypothetical protein